MLHIRNAHTSETSQCQPKSPNPCDPRACAGRSFPASPRTATSQDFALHVTRKRAFWAMSYQPRGHNPSTGKRWGGGVRHELGDAMLMTVAEARQIGAGGQVARPGRTKPASRSNGLHGPRGGAAFNHPDDRSRSPRRLCRRPRNPATALRDHAEKIHPLRQQSPQIDEDRKRAARVNRRAHDPPHGRNDDRLRRRTTRRLRRTQPLSELGSQTRPGRNQRLRRPRSPRTPEARQGARSRPIAGRAARRVERRRKRTATRPRQIHVAHATAPQRSRRPAHGAKSICSAGRIRIISRPHEKRRSARIAIVGASAQDPRGEHGVESELVFPSSTRQACTPHGAISSLGCASASARPTRPKPSDSFSTTSGDAFVSHLAERGFDVDLLDHCLGHTRHGVFGVYQRASRMAERGRAMEAWAGLVTGAGEAEAGGFWPFQRGRPDNRLVYHFHSPVRLKSPAEQKQIAS